MHPIFAARTSHTMKVTAGELAVASLIGFEHEAGGMLFVTEPLDAPVELEIFASTKRDGSFVPVEGAAMTVHQAGAYPIPSAAFAAPFLKIVKADGPSIELDLSIKA